MSRIAIIAAISSAALALFALMPKVVLPSTLHSMANSLNTTTLAWDYIFPITELLVLTRYSIYILGLYLLWIAIKFIVQNLDKVGGGAE